MTSSSNLQDLERKIFATYFHDGMWDIYGGLLLLGFGLGMLTGQMYLLIVCVFLAMIPLLLRKRIVIPRLGLVKFSPERQARTKRQKLIAVVTGSIILILGIVFAALFSGDLMPGWLVVWMADYFLATFGGMLAVIIVIAAYLVGVRRFYGYAGLVLASFVLAGILRPRDLEGVPVIAVAGIVLLSGITLLIHFLLKYRPSAQEKNDDPYQ